MHQYLFFIGDFPIRSYGVILSLSIFLATGADAYAKDGVAAVKLAKKMVDLKN